MRLGSSSLFQRHATGKDGAIIEEGDGEIIFPPVLQLTTGVGGPMRRFGPTTGKQEGSFMADTRRNKDNAQGPLTDNVAEISSGIWHIDWTFSVVFTGTTQTGTFDFVMKDSDDNLHYIASFRAITTPITKSISGSLQFDLLEDGNVFQLIMPTTVALDLSYSAASIVCNRLA